MKRAIFFAATVFAGVLIGNGLGSVAWGVGEGTLWGALAGAVFGASVALAALKTGDAEPQLRGR